MPKDAYYFPHDSNASQDPKILQMCSVYKAEGYGWYWMLIEKMREQEDYKLPINGKYALNAFAMPMHTNADTLASFIGDCINEFHLFSRDKEYLWSDSLIRRMKVFDEKSKKARRSAEIRWGKKASQEDAPALRTHCHRNASKVKYSKGDIYSVFTLWNSVEIIHHKKLTDEIKRAIEIKLKDFPLDEMCQAIKNYAEIVKDDQYYFNHSWTLKEFLTRGLEKFMNMEVAKRNFKTNNGLAGKREGKESKSRGRAYQATN